MEPLQRRLVSVFLPQTPTPRSGNVMYFSADRVLLLNRTMVEAGTIVKRIGVGSGAAHFEAPTSSRRGPMMRGQRWIRDFHHLAGRCEGAA